MKHHRWVFSILVLFLTLGLVVEAQAQAKRIRMGLPAVSMGGMPFFLARDKGYYEEEGLNVELIVMRAPLVNIALIAKEIDISMVLVSGTMVALRGLPLINIFVAFQQPQHAVITKAEIRTISDLKGKRVGILRVKMLDDLLLQDVLKPHGLKIPRDVEVLGVGSPPTRLAALLSGRVDAVVLATPYNFRAEEAGFRRLLVFRDYGYILPSGGSIVRKGFLQREKKSVRKFLRATMKGMLYLKENRSGAISEMARILKVKPPMATKIYDDVMPTMAPGGVMNQENRVKFMDLVLRFARKKESPPLEDLFDFSIAQEVLAELKAKGWKPGS